MFLALAPTYISDSTRKPDKRKAQEQCGGASARYRALTYVIGNIADKHAHQDPRSSLRIIDAIWPLRCKRRGHYLYVEGEHRSGKPNNTASKSTFSDVIKSAILDSRSSSPDSSIKTLAPAGFEAEGAAFKMRSSFRSAIIKLRHRHH